MDNEERFKKEVIDYIDTCFKTTIIGAIAEVEHEIDKESFKDIRKRILDKGNDQRRNVIKLLQKIGINKSQYSYVFEVKPLKIKFDKDR